jgi:hypothetical protein
MTKKSPATVQKENTLTVRATEVNLFSVAASVMPGSDPEAADGDRRAEDPHRDPHLVEVPADLLWELAMTAQTSTETATALRDWIAGVMLQLADVARDGIAHLDRDEIEVARFVLDFIANAPKRLGIAPEGRHA